MSVFRFAARMLRRDAGAGELRLLFAAVLVGVAALSAVGFFTDRVRQLLEREATQLLGADLLLVADRPWSEDVSATARRLGLRTATTQTFPSMVAAGEGAQRRVQLAEVKAVSPEYPLRGQLRVRQTPQPVADELASAADRAAGATPAPGTVWLDERAATALALRVRDKLTLGRSTLILAEVLTQEPDRGVNFFSVAPRVLISLDDLAASGLLSPGSRVVHRLLVAGDPGAVQRFRAVVAPRLAAGQRIEDVENARPEIRAALERAQRFLGIAAVLTLVLAAIAVALAARRYLQRHLDACAVLRCLGATQAFLLRTYLVQFLLLGTLAALAGCLVGYAAHFLLHAWLAQILARDLPPPGFMPAMQGMVIGVSLLLAFSLPTLLRLKQVSTLRVLRREFDSGPRSAWRVLGAYGLGVGVLAGIMLWVAGEVRLGVYLMLGFALALAVFMLVARLLVRLVARFRAGSGAEVGWRLGLANLERHAAANVVQIVSLALAFMALLLLTATRNDLLAAWQRAVPPDAPNRFVINIQPEQLAGVRQHFAAAGLDVEFAPMIRARLSAVNGRAVSAADFTDERAKRLVEREFNLSYRASLPPGNRVQQGRWFAKNEAGKPLASLEEGLAQSLGLKVGDRLRFVVAGETVDVDVVGLRKLNWDSMRVNFFVLTPLGVLEEYPASWITSFYLPPAHSDFVPRLIGEYPNLTVVDITAIIDQLKAILEQVTRAVEFVFFFTLLAGGVVLYSALAFAAEERRYELAVLRALGATQCQLRRALWVELAALGAIAGLIASTAALIAGQVFAQRLFQLDTPVDWLLIPISILAGGVSVPLVGWWAVRCLLAFPALHALRASA